MTIFDPNLISCSINENTRLAHEYGLIQIPEHTPFLHCDESVQGLLEYKGVKLFSIQFITDWLSTDNNGLPTNRFKVDDTINQYLSALMSIDSLTNKNKQIVIDEFNKRLEECGFTETANLDDLKAIRESIKLNMPTVITTDVNDFTYDITNLTILKGDNEFYNLSYSELILAQEKYGFDNIRIDDMYPTKTHYPR